MIDVLIGNCFSHRVVQYSKNEDDCKVFCKIKKTKKLPQIDVDELSSAGAWYRNTAPIFLRKPYPISSQDQKTYPKTYKCA